MRQHRHPILVALIAFCLLGIWLIVLYHTIILLITVAVLAWKLHKKGRVT